MKGDYNHVLLFNICYATLPMPRLNILTIYKHFSGHQDALFEISAKFLYYIFKCFHLCIN